MKCSKCQGFFNEKYFYRHKVKCLQNVSTDSQVVKAIPLENSEEDHAKMDEGSLLKNMRRDDIFDIIKSDPTLTHVDDIILALLT